MKKFYLKIFGSIIGLSMLFWLITKTGTYEILQAMKTVELSDVICALSLILCGIYLRALRWRSLFSRVDGIGVYPFFLQL